MAFSKATDLVTGGSEDAYRKAIALRHEEQVAAAVYAYDKDPHWSPYQDFDPLLSSEQLEARVKILDGLKTYADTLVKLTNRKDPSKDLTSAAEAAGTNLQGLNKTLATDLATSIPNAPVMSDSVAHGVSTAVLALGDYLINRKTRRSLREVTQQMNPHVETLCSLLSSDVTVLRRQADVDYQALVIDQDQFIRHSKLSAVEHRDEVGKLIVITEDQKANDELLAKLDKAVKALATAHQSLTDAAATKDTETLKQKIADLETAGQELGSFYSSLSAKAKTPTTATAN
ncbi:hypothetical protein [Silvibacterium acidisoli]|uniref:hypothetical protein n=1 Tax=Acidobacteriaceae bacterium ZG23-2 TaxID=2883246 RepID=UPI00406CE82B